MSNDGKCQDLQDHTIHIFWYLKMWIQIRCFALIWAFLHVRTFTSPTHNPLALFHWKWWGRPKLTPLLTCFGLPILGGCWLFFLGILLSSHNDERRWINFMLFENCALMFPPWEGTPNNHNFDASKGVKTPIITILAFQILLNFTACMRKGWIFKRNLQLIFQSDMEMSLTVWWQKKSNG
jgi:hypothetical protein